MTFVYKVINRVKGTDHREIFAYFLYLTVETKVTLRRKTHCASVSSKCECANGTLA